MCRHDHLFEYSNQHTCIRQSKIKPERPGGSGGAYRHRQSIRESHDGYHNGANLPSPFHGLALVSLGPEQVEEEAGAEDRGYGYADEYVVGGDADEIVVLDEGAAVASVGDSVLLVDVICV